eukprot:TRINITY_DN2662_c0_g1_i3.p1 TRINITY_DN2662_c0_g1~~TRINITY_DN2662_c0_g1_i3.p1  ORF type:complete len:1149 (+),score=170.28 TRINITY_DN2662_c0_g1_i3:188-3634(+)
MVVPASSNLDERVRMLLSRGVCNGGFQHYLSIARMYDDTRDYSTALDYVQQYVSHSDRDPQAYLFLASIYEKLERPLDAAHALKRVLSLNPHKNEAYYENAARIAHLLLRGGSYSDAQCWKARAGRGVAVGEGILIAPAGQRSISNPTGNDAVDILTLAIESDPRNLSLHFSLLQELERANATETVYRHCETFAELMADVEDWWEWIYTYFKSYLAAGVVQGVPIESAQICLVSSMDNRVRLSLLSPSIEDSGGLNDNGISECEALLCEFRSVVRRVTDLVEDPSHRILMKEYGARVYRHYGMMHYINMEVVEAHHLHSTLHKAWQCFATSLKIFNLSSGHKITQSTTRHLVALRQSEVARAMLEMVEENPFLQQGGGDSVSGISQSALLSAATEADAVLVKCEGFGLDRVVTLVAWMVRRLYVTRVYQWLVGVLGHGFRRLPEAVARQYCHPTTRDLFVFLVTLAMRFDRNPSLNDAQRQTWRELVEIALAKFPLNVPATVLSRHLTAIRKGPDNPHVLFAVAKACLHVQGNAVPELAAQAHDFLWRARSILSALLERPNARDGTSGATYRRLLADCDELLPPDFEQKTLAAQQTPARARLSFDESFVGQRREGGHATLNTTTSSLTSGYSPTAHDAPPFASLCATSLLSTPKSCHNKGHTSERQTVRMAGLRQLSSQCGNLTSGTISTPTTPLNDENASVIIGKHHPADAKPPAHPVLGSSTLATATATAPPLSLVGAAAKQCDITATTGIPPPAAAAAAPKPTSFSFGPSAPGGFSDGNSALGGASTPTEGKAGGFSFGGGQEAAVSSSKLFGFEYSAPKNASTTSSDGFGKSGNDGFAPASGSSGFSFGSSPSSGGSVFGSSTLSANTGFSFGGGAKAVHSTAPPATVASTQPGAFSFGDNNSPHSPASSPLDVKENVATTTPPSSGGFSFGGETAPSRVPDVNSGEKKDAHPPTVNPQGGDLVWKCPCCEHLNDADIDECGECMIAVPNDVELQDRMVVAPSGGGGGGGFSFGSAPSATPPTFGSATPSSGFSFGGNNDSKSTPAAATATALLRRQRAHSASEVARRTSRVGSRSVAHHRHLPVGPCSGAVRQLADSRSAIRRRRKILQKWRMCNQAKRRMFHLQLTTRRSTTTTTTTRRVPT